MWGEKDYDRDNSLKKEKLCRAYNERRWDDERGVEKENGGQEATKQKASLDDLL